MPTPKPPVAEQHPVRSEHHGRTTEDPYAWLRDREDPRVRAYLEAENAFAEATLASTATLQAELYEEMIARTQETDVSAPMRDGPYLYYWRTTKGQDYAQHCRRPLRKGAAESEAGPEHVYLDHNTLAEGHAYFAIGDRAAATGHGLLAYTVDATGDERYTIRIREFDNGQELPDEIEDVARTVVWAADNEHLFYLRLDAAQRPFEVWRHRLGTPAGADERVFVEEDERFFVSVHRGRSDRFVYITSDSKITSEVHALDATRPCEPLRLIAARRPGVEYAVVDQGDRFFIVTNEDALNFKVVTAPLDSPSPAHWTPFVEHRADTLVERVDAFAGHIVLSLRRGGLPVLRVMPTGDESPHDIEMPEPVYLAGAGPNAVYETTTLRFFYASLVTPHSIFDYDIRTRQRTLRKQYEVKNYDQDSLITERIHATAPDGTAVPISVVRRKRDVGTPQPLLLMGYGAYGFSYDPRFSSARVSLLERGVAVAIAHVRGGGELGRAWYEAGKLMHKKNTFSDFIAAAEHLVALGYAQPDALAMHGGSAGGLLIGTVMNARPDLFTAAVADVPFVDVLNTMLDADLPLTVTEWEEWGDPREPEPYAYIASYAPYENVAAQRYPHLLALAGWSDPRVGYWEPAKWVARLRAVGTPGSEILLRTQLEAGHAGPSGRYPAFARLAVVYAFILRHLTDASRSPG